LGFGFRETVVKNWFDRFADWYERLPSFSLRVKPIFAALPPDGGAAKKQSRRRKRG
jgi:hypothetical protein